MSRGAIYTCTIDNYDTIVSPVVSTPGCDHLLFSDRRPPLTPGWQFRPLPVEAKGMQGNEANRYCKMFSHELLAGYDFSIYVDGNVLITANLTPLIEAFLSSGCDIALFGYLDTNWSVLDDMNKALAAGRIPKERRTHLETQKRIYAERGWLGLPVTENGVIFRRHGRPSLERLMQDWWTETRLYTMRDQFTLPGLLQGSDVRVHRWDWHYSTEGNGYFARFSHRRAVTRAWGSFSDMQFASLMRARFSRRDRMIQRVVEAVRRAAGRAPVPDYWLEPIANNKKRGS